jgi:uncharacterized membrane protein YedE/YeeE
VNIVPFDPVAPLVGGALIGLSASLVLLTQGKVAGISGIYGGLLQSNPSDTTFRGWFLAGLLVAGIVVRMFRPELFSTATVAGYGTLIAAGLLVGFGSRLGNGCTSGHGVCGISRLSVRSIAASLTFMTTGALAVAVTRWVTQ